jgi:hypothetical protein
MSVDCDRLPDEAFLEADVHLLTHDISCMDASVA